jgi:hypothetical protein
MCRVTISTVNGVVVPTAVDPSQLQITGTLQDCEENNVVVTVKDASGAVIAGPSPQTAINANGQWVALLSVAAGSVTCGATLSVVAACASDPACPPGNLSLMSLPCCMILVQDVIGKVAPGMLQPSAISVDGSAFGCYGGQVTITVTDTSSGVQVAGPSTVMIDAITGAFSATLGVAGAVRCFDKVDVVVACAQNSSCTVTHAAILDCPACNIRAQVSPMTGACTGSPPIQPVTLVSTIAVPVGATECYRWDFGDGSALGAVFRVPPAGAAASTGNNTYQITEPPHSYPLGTFTAKLRWVNCATGSIQQDNCPPLSFPVTTDCCPVTVGINNIAVGPCTGNGTASVTITFNCSGVPAGWLAEIVGLVDGMQQGMINCGNGNASLTLFVPSVAAGSHTVGLRIISPTGCPDITRKVATPACPCCVPAANLACPVSGCGSGVTVTFSLDPTNPWTWPKHCDEQKVQASSFDLEISQNGTPLYRRTVASLPASSQDNAWLDLASGATGPISFPATGGNYTVGVVAQIAGLTCAASQSSAGFKVDPCCPQITSLKGLVSDGDPCTVDFTATVVGDTSGATFTWSFSDGTSTTSQSPTVSHAYPSSTTSASVTLTMTTSKPDCPPEKTSAKVSLDGCTCPVITIPTAAVTGCVDATHGASVTFGTSVTPAVSGASINWTVTTPAGTPFTKTTAGATTTDGATDGPWRNSVTGATGALDVTASGAYAVSIAATGSGIPPSCAMPAPKGFAIPACSSSSSTNWGCVILRWAAVFLFIAAGYSWLLYFCMGPMLAATPYTAWIPYVLLAIAIVLTVAAVALLVVWLLLPICTGKPCRWALLLLWQISIGFGTTAFYFINCCTWTLWVGIGSLALGVGLMGWWWVACKRTWCEVAAELAPVISAVIALIAYAALIAAACINTIVGVIVGTVSAVLVFAIAYCLGTGTQPAGN